MRRKGQVTVFIIIGIIIVLSAALLLYAVTKNQETISEQQPLFVSTINNYVSSCIESTAIQGLVAVGVRGGYYQPKQLLAGQTIAEVPYYFYEGQKTVPDKEQIKREVSYFISTNIDDCINNFTSFNDSQYKIIKYGYLTRIVADFKGDKVTVEMDYPVDISSGNKVYSIKTFNKEIALDFNKIYSIIEEIVRYQEENPDYSPIGKISELAYKNNFTFDTITYEENTVLYELEFNDSKAISPYLFAFAVKYNWTDIGIDETGAEI